ncbi:hydrogenase nickel incorporation protein HypA/HybF [Prauserella shujinwangii]|uniref:Hydrogenase maturation factor HypA n=1 Tax=Prauserella shujinwangii TaxID=1453103 RepID=A0A2T0M2Q6_9PSEU|nr:hydrogenase maturation nickel metallochaperone HypA [Prauserella shujinwangii]PRX51006.1 hydrogenase nickel incorporation protein HypA/HybF [Prauserella shujinwangii]
MHELSIAQSIVSGITEQVGDRNVLRVGLEIGRLSGVEVDAIRFCFDVVAAGTPVEGAELVIDEPPGRARCRGCGAESALADLLGGCACGGLDLEVLSGEQLRIREVRVQRDVRDVRV